MGGSGTWPRASTSHRLVTWIVGPQADAAASEESLFEHLADKRRRRPRTGRSRRASASWPGCISASHSTASRRAASGGRESEQALDAPPLGTRWPISRAANTRVSFTTSRSPAAVLSASSALPARRASFACSRAPEPRRAARRGLLCDQILGQIEIEVRDEHRETLLPQPSWRGSCIQPA